MPPNERELLQKVVELEQENNKILRGMRRVTRWAVFFSIVKWVIIIGVTLGAAYYVKPYLDAITKIYSQVGGSGGSGGAFQEGWNKLQSFDVGKIREFFESFKSASSTHAG